MQTHLVSEVNTYAYTWLRLMKALSITYVNNTELLSSALLLASSYFFGIHTCCVLSYSQGIMSMQLVSFCMAYIVHICYRLISQTVIITFLTE